MIAVGKGKRGRLALNTGSERREEVISFAGVLGKTASDPRSEEEVKYLELRNWKLGKIGYSAHYGRQRNAQL